MSFRKPISTMRGYFWWSILRQNKYFLLQEHRVGRLIWPYRYRILMRENGMEIANANDPEDIQLDWQYLQENAIPQLDNKIDFGEVFRKLIDGL